MSAYRILSMLDEKYYRIITKILNENLCKSKFNYEMILNQSYYLYGNYVKKTNLAKFVGYLKKWKFIEYKQGANYPFTLTRLIPYSLVGVICKNKYLTDKEREDIVQEHYMMQRRGKILKLRERVIKIKENETVIL